MRTFNILFIGLLIITQSSGLKAQSETSIESLQERIRILELTELVQSMTQRSLLTPGYQPELKALIACQAYNFWKQNTTEKYVSHLNVYSALHYANKYLQYDSMIQDYAYNQILGHDQMVVSIEFGSNPSYFYSAGSDGRVLKWDTNNPHSIPESIYQSKDLIRSIDVTDDDDFLMVVTKNSGIVLINLNAGLKTEINDPLIDAENVQAASFLPNKKAYLTVNRKGEIKIKGYEYDTAAIGQSAAKILSIAINPADYGYYLGTKSGTIEKLDQTGKAATFSFDKAYAINAMDISPDNKMLAIGRELGDAILWDLEKKQPIRTISGHQSAVTDVEFSPDSKTLLTASRDGTARVWDIWNTRKFPIVLDDHKDWVMTAAFNKEGNQILTGSKDNFIRIWQVNPTDLAERICEHIGRNLTEEEWTEYVGENIPYQQTCPF